MPTYDIPLSNDGPDPYALPAPPGGHYVMVTRGDRVELMHVAGDLRDPRSWQIAKKRDIWRPSTSPGPADPACDIWAPEIHVFQGRWYIYFTGNTPDGHDLSRRVYVLRGPPAEQDPMTGDWSYGGRLKLPDDSYYTIDLTLLTTPLGKSYFIFSSKRPMDGYFYQHLVVCEAIDPTTGGARETVISAPTSDWERHDHPVNEGPQVLTRGNDLWLGFSASAYWTDQYAVGFLHAKLDADLLDVRAWKKFDRPFFRQMPEKGVFGPGHASFVKPSADSSDDDWWFLYHARSKPLGKHDVPRVPHIRPVRWEPDGTPRLSD